MTASLDSEKRGPQRGEDGLNFSVMSVSCVFRPPKRAWL